MRSSKQGAAGLLASLTLVAVGCAIPLEDGRYGCARGPCPPSLFCHRDRLCYAAPEDAGALDAASSLADASVDTGATRDGWVVQDVYVPRDAFAQPDAYVPGDAAIEGEFLRPCTSSSMCASGLCYFPNEEPYGTGYCTPMCTRPEMCPMAAACSGNACVVTCSASRLCPMGMRCALRDRRDGECLPIGVAPLPVAPTACTGSRCSVGVCASRECRRACLNDAGCPDNERCTDELCVPR